MQKPNTKNKVREQWTTNELEKYTKGANTKRTNAANIDKSVRFLALKPGFHMIVQVVPIAPVVSKYFETTRTTGAIGSFHMIFSIASKARDAGSLAMSLRQTIETLSLFVSWRTYLISFTEQYCFLFRFVCIELVSLIWFLQIWVAIYVYGTMINWSTLIKKLMQSYIVKVSGSIFNISTVYLNGICSYDVVYRKL